MYCMKWEVTKRKKSVNEMSILMPSVKLICPINIGYRKYGSRDDLSDESLFRLPRTGRR